MSPILSRPQCVDIPYLGTLIRYSDGSLCTQCKCQKKVIQKTRWMAFYQSSLNGQFSILIYRKGMVTLEYDLQ